MITPPTDCLYKWIAIAGAVIMLAAGAGPYSMYNDIQNDALAWDFKDGEVARLIECRDAPCTEEQESTLLLARDELGVVMALKQAELFRTGLASLFFAAIGFTMMLFGFVQWYFKVQRYEDRILKRKAEDD